MQLLKLKRPHVLADDIATKWKSRHGKQLQPTTALNYATAIQVAAKYQKIPIDAWKFRRVMRGIKKDLSLHTAKQAIPMTKQQVKRVINHPAVNPTVQRAVAFTWLLGLRAGDLCKIQEKDVTKFGHVMRVRARGLKGYQHGRVAHYRWLPHNGLANRVWSDLKIAARMQRSTPLFNVSRSRILRALRLVLPAAGSHSLRRGVATHLANKGMSMRHIKCFLERPSGT